MMKKPTTKKLPEKQVARTVTAKGKPFMKLFSDEKFYQYPRYTNVFVSQYGNVISTTGTVPHEQFPALYPDDIENISNMSEEKSYLCCQIQATLLQRMRSSTPIDTSCWCTCPKKESQN